LFFLREIIMSLKKILLVFFTVGIILWGGVSIARTVIAYDIFVPFDTEMNFKADYRDGILFHNVYLYADLAVYALAGYVLMIFSGVILFLRERKENFKSRAWIMMAAILFALSIPYEVFAGYASSKLSFAIFSGGLRDFGSEIVKDNFLKLFTDTNIQIWATLSKLSAYTAVLVLVVKPLDGLPKNEIESCDKEPGNENS
jgi:hypothetical protein